MRKQLSCLVLIILTAATLYGQATRTWVSGVGDDANPCSRTAPCKTWAGAISKTAAGGEIDALDPGGFGALTITKAITLDGGGGQVASVLVSGTNGIVVAAGASDVVIIRNLRLNGLLGSGSPGLSGIRFISGKDLNVENCVIFGFGTNAVDIELGASGTAHIIDTIIKNNGSCAPGSCSAGSGDGIFATTTSGLIKVGVSNTSIMVSSNNGIESGNNSRVTVDRGFISASGGSGVAADGTGGTAIAGIDNSTVIDGNNGLTATNTSTVVVSHTTITSNTGTAYNASGGSIFAYARGTGGSTAGTNRVHDNTALGTAIYIPEN
jgi:hypothetical protein